MRIPEHSSGEKNVGLVPSGLLAIKWFAYINCFLASFWVLHWPYDSIISIMTACYHKNKARHPEHILLCCYLPCCDFLCLIRFIDQVTFDLTVNTHNNFRHNFGDSPQIGDVTDTFNGSWSLKAVLPIRTLISNSKSNKQP